VSNTTDSSLSYFEHSWEDSLTGLPAVEDADAEQTRKQLLLAEWEAQTTAGVMDILLRVENSEGLAQGCATLVNGFQHLVGCRQVALGICGKHPESFHLLTVSGMATVDRRSENARDTEAVLAEAVLRGELTVWPLAVSVSRNATLAHQILSLHADAPVVISSPLRITNDKTAAAWLFLGKKELAENPAILGLLRASEPRVAASLDLLRRSEPSRIRRWFRRLNERRRKMLTRTLPIFLGILLLAF
jgi:hypothetical protein